MTLNFQTKCRSWIKSLCIPLAAILIVPFAGRSYANPSLYYAPRGSISLPNGCAFVAHSGQYKTLPDLCAEMLLGLDKALKSSWLNKECDVYEFHDLQYATAGVPMHDYLKFLPLGNGKFLIRLACFMGAYNWGTLIFAYDESHRLREKKGDATPVPLPSLIIFPNLHAPYASTGFSYTVNARDFDDRHAVLYHLDKIIGDGSGGDYAEYEINRTTFIPTLRRNIFKSYADHEDGYNFSRGEIPRGKDWHSDDVRSVPSGCLMTLEDDHLPVTEPAVTCSGRQATVRQR